MKTEDDEFAFVFCKLIFCHEIMPALNLGQREEEERVKNKLRSI